jgi:K+/H+ antiporter YhaU regulatory subunit KhtT
VILADESLEPAAADAETILIMAKISKLCEEQPGGVSSQNGHDLLTIVAEVMQPQNVELAEFAGRIKHGCVEVVSSQHFAQDLLAQVAVTPGLTKIYHELLAFGSNNNEIWGCELGERFHNKPLEDLFQAVAELRTKCNTSIAPVAISRNGKIYVNPSSDRIGLLKKEDELYAICDNKDELRRLR